MSYYYFGHWLVALVGRLAGQTPEVAYTLGQAAWYGLLALGCFGLGANLVRLQAPSARPRRAIAAGVLATVTVALAGNLQGTLDVLQRAGLRLQALSSGRGQHNFAPPSDHWWWWRSSRVLADRAPDGTHVEVIDEFPAFSYVLGDDHSHVLAQPFVLLALALALNRYLARGRPRAVEGGAAGRGVWRRSRSRTRPTSRRSLCWSWPRRGPPRVARAAAPGSPRWRRPSPSWWERRCCSRPSS